MTVHFIGAGPGAPDLITVRGLQLVRSCPVCLYAGSLVPADLVKETPPAALVLDTASMHLDEIIGTISHAHSEGKDVARVHSGDPSLYGAIAEQIARLDALAIPWTITPGVPAFAAAAAELGIEYTLPGLAQSVVLTRTSVRSSAMPEGESLASFGRTGATLAIHLSINNLAAVIRELTPVLGGQTPVIVVHRVTWPDQLVIRGTLETIRQKVKKARITRTALILVGKTLESELLEESRLYAEDHTHALRPARPRS